MKTSDNPPVNIHGINTSKKIAGAKCRIATDTNTDTLDLLLAVTATPDGGLNITARHTLTKAFMRAERRWIVERSIGWLMPRRRLARD